ncbi:esterase [Cryobacterium sp. LW097]|uniref:alpha/beta hydrolase n=1 Tax=unclassified Cryobacterium TaxID=2649013 RepID=UPI000B4C4507|nr:MULTISPECIES: alpha/beta hydrolase [unclassified Cryobacterium]ASD21813.1 esterase [Cryobacterium sp. LW097]TFC52302.1 alpha/beta hydrolase [Cryobacterium sp. TMB3-1-2]TFC69798.1 alpha/beta hydrolase [Cryobacterium sp. TMB3-15]TFC79047.1 alpha/beta hydrolase [Cryobacterium sp. TMB3-10]TFD39124.1 alpha/beta hydrolase [Cryobacterium sp. TMB3-12]
MIGRTRGASETENADVGVDAVIQGPHGPVPVRRYAPPVGTALVGAAPDGTALVGSVSLEPAPIVWVHGGAFVKGGLDLPETHEVALALAAAGFTVITVDYRLTSIPGLSRFGRTAASTGRIHFPVPVDDVVAVVRAVQGEFGDGVILGGASAGACLSAGAVLRLAHGGAEPLRGVFFAYGLFHASLPERSRELRSRLRGRRRFTHTPLLLNAVNRIYAGTRAALADPYAFPGGHSLPDFPPALLIDADSDSMRASGEQFAKELAAARVPVEYHVLTDAAHAFLNRPKSPDFAAGIRLIVDWARRL